LTRSDSCYCRYIVYHYCLRFDRGDVHVVVVIFSTNTVWGLTEEWFMLLSYCLSLLFKVWQRSGTCCCRYNVYHCYLRFDRGMVHVLVVILYSIIDYVCQRSNSCCFGWLHCLPLLFSLTEEWFMLWLLYCLPLLFKAR
jgi:hypothetical protein